VLLTLCRRLGHTARAGFADGKDDLFAKFHKILRVLEVDFDATHFLVVPDLHPEMDCAREAERWRNAIGQRFPKARLCLSIWELEAWLLADPRAVAATFRLREFHHANPDQIGAQKPSEILEDAYRRAYGYGRGLAFDKGTDGQALAEELDFETARRASPSFGHFLRELGTRQERLS
jgi:hypothetical protein